MGALEVWEQRVGVRNRSLVLVGSEEKEAAEACVNIAAETRLYRSILGSWRCLNHVMLCDLDD